MVLLLGLMKRVKEGAKLVREPRQRVEPQIRILVAVDAPPWHEHACSSQCQARSVPSSLRSMQPCFTLKSTGLRDFGGSFAPAASPSSCLPRLQRCNNDPPDKTVIRSWNLLDVQVTVLLTELDPFGQQETCRSMLSSGGGRDGRSTLPGVAPGEFPTSRAVAY